MTPARIRPLLLAVVPLVWVCSCQGQQPEPAPEKKYDDFNKVVAGAKSFDGLFKLHLKDENLYAEIRNDQLDRPFLAPVAIARGMGMGGTTLNSDEQWVIAFKRVGEKIHVVRRNVKYSAKQGTPVSRAVETTYTDSVLYSIPIRTVNPARNTVVIDLRHLFMTNFAALRMGQFDPERSTWHKVKAFPRNLEIQVSATYTGRGDDTGADPRGSTLVIHYGLVELPEAGYQPRYADDRVGHFLTVHKDFTSDNRDTSFVRYVNRWRLERVDGSPWKEGAKLVPPKKKIVFWIERSVPDEYRASVREGILEWNKAFERVGFRDAIEVRQQENEDFDPEDANYNTFRWITTDRGFAMGPSRANPFTGELLDADIIFDASMVRAYKQEQQLFKNGRGLLQEAPSLIEASRKGWLSRENPLAELGSWNERAADPLKEARDRLSAIRQGMCQCASHKSYELGLAQLTLATRFNLKPGDKIGDEVIQQAVKETTMHEVGHTLGLRHNFKASTMLKADQLHNLEITRKRGLVGSVMDYNPTNIAPKGVKQGDFFSTTIGPYDYWAIEYAYRPLTGGTDGEVAELQKIASRCAEPGLDYGTDEDLMSADPNINMWDLGSDPMKFAQDRITLAEELMKGVADRVVEKGEGYQRARQAFSLLLRQFGDGAFLTAQHVGGEYLYRDHRGDANARDPVVPVSGAKQREGLKFLQQHILTDKPFSFPPELLRKLAADRWLHWGNEDSVIATDFSLNDRVLQIQRVVLRTLLANGTLDRVQDLAAKVDAKDQPLTVAEIFRSLTDSIFADLPTIDQPATATSTLLRRNLQREYVRDLNGMLLRGAVPADARSLARMHLKEINARTARALQDKKLTDETVRAHLQENFERIEKALGASLQARE